MALSLPGERSVAAGSHVNPARALFAWFTRAKANRTRRAALTSLLDLDAAHLRDLGITRQDVAEALLARDGRTPGMVLNAARSRNAR
ncbi:hypothetical protein [Devosia sediminis]|uniref:DUF1127 domain-containing protein n=1 Tax=Devosia sediminis TaxID=2798801 RepID=A0A934MK88_9HYPH|nr:hypothetical protein [Devosia sediminis]MBJ3784878.1 hypothetical protein [Devosia sediminis]